MATVTINQSEVSIKEWQGNRVVTFKDIDLVHGRPDGTARKRFNDNKERFIEGTDYFVRKTDEAKNEFNIVAPNGLTLITESGYLMLVKSFTDDLAWDVQRQLVNLYFRVQNQTAIVPVKNKKLALPTRLIVRTYNDEMVVTSFEAAEYFMQTTDYLRYHAKSFFDKDFDYYLLSGEELIDFKAQNLSYSRPAAKLFVYTKSGFLKFCERFNVAVSEEQLSAFNVNNAIEKGSALSAHEELLKSCEDLTAEEIRKVFEFIAEMKKVRLKRIDKSISIIQLNMVRINDLLNFFTRDDFDADERNKYSATLDGLIGFGFELFNEIQNLKSEF